MARKSPVVRMECRSNKIQKSLILISYGDPCQCIENGALAGMASIHWRPLSDMDNFRDNRDLKYILLQGLLSHPLSHRVPYGLWVRPRPITPPASQ